MGKPTQAPPRHDGLALFERRWAVRVLLAVASGAHRFSQLRDKLPGIPVGTLTTRLRELAKDRLVHRIVDPGPPTVTTYEVTTRAKSLCDALLRVARWHG